MNLRLLPIPLTFLRRLLRFRIPSMILQLLQILSMFLRLLQIPTMILRLLPIPSMILRLLQIPTMILQLLQILSMILQHPRGVLKISQNSMARRRKWGARRARYWRVP